MGVMMHVLEPFPEDHQVYRSRLSFEVGPGRDLVLLSVKEGSPPDGRAKGWGFEIGPFGTEEEALRFGRLAAVLIATRMRG